MSKVVLITGSSSGFGKLIAKKLSDFGFKVYGTCRDSKKYKKPKKYELISCDITKSSDLKKIIKYITDKEKKIDILINNAGIGFTGPIEEILSENLIKTFETNLFGHIKLMQSIVPMMRKNKSGLIINITSIAAYNSIPFVGVYSSTKASLKIIGESLNMELHSYGIKVVNIAPGDYKTNAINNRSDTKIKNNSPYYESYNSLIKHWDLNMKKSRNPNEIADLVFKVIKTPNPKINYVIGGFLQKISIKLRKILPEKIYQKLIMNHYKL